VRLRQSGLDQETEAINRAGVEAVRRAVGDRAYVSASVGPCGHVLKPYGDADPAEIASGFERQIRALASAGIDLLCIETMTDLTEAILAVRAARAVAPQVPVMATMTFEPTRRGFFTVMGNSSGRRSRVQTSAPTSFIRTAATASRSWSDRAQFRRDARALVSQPNAATSRRRDRPDTPDPTERPPAADLGSDHRRVPRTTPGHIPIRQVGTRDDVGRTYSASTLISRPHSSRPGVARSGWRRLSCGSIITCSPY
jgi:hypothetical protein